MHVGKARLKSCVFTASRTGYCCGIAALVLLIGSKSLQDAVAEGDTRTISMHHIHTDEDITITYKRNGRYDDEALKKLNHFLRDWRREEEIKMDPHLLDLVWEVDREVGRGQPIWVVCGYRAPQTNAMLRRRSGGVARYSQHMLGRAMDFYIPSADLEDLRIAGLRLQRGGVGYYPSSGSPFVHLDTGSVRHWPRMTHDQLARVFPDGRTVHIPSDGHPLSGYALALADIEKRGNRPSGTSLESARNSGVNVDTVVASADRPKQNPLAKLFGFGPKENDEEADAVESAASAKTTPASKPAPRKPAKSAVVAALERGTDQKTPPAPARAAAPAQPKAAQVAAATMSPLQIASIPVLPSARTTTVAAPTRPAQTASLVAAGASANDVIATRGYWQGLPDGMIAAHPGNEPANATAGRTQAHRTEIASADPGSTGTVGPWRVEASDRVPPDLALAYATQSQPDPAPRASPMGTAATRVIASNDTTTALKRAAVRAKLQAAVHAPSATVKAQLQQYDNPWLRAVVVSPSVHQYLTITLLGARDYRRLEPLMRKPASSVMMTFSDDPHLGLQHERFSGSAVVFVSTITFPTRTAALQ